MLLRHIYTMNTTNTLTKDWRPDILGDSFEMKYVRHPDDYCGEVRSSIIRYKGTAGAAKGILYVHGFSDYFFQKELAEMFAAHGYAFYAVDLRRYGRSLSAGQKMFRVRDLHEYFADIDAAVAQMHADGTEHIALLGHSTGGLTASLYMSEAPSPSIRVLMLNSPFLDWNLPKAVKRFAIPLVSLVGAVLPDIPVHQTPDPAYGMSLKDCEYRREWKPDILPDPDTGWVRAISTAQRELRRRSIKAPVLLMHSARSARRGDSAECYASADAILDVADISYYGRRLGDDVTDVSIDGGLHDLALSPTPVRRKVFAVMTEWLAKKGM